MGGRVAAYDRLGRTYTATRRADPRIAAAIEDALGDARTVVNVGAGAGSYEPRDREVVAVEPSATMIAQRPPGAAPVVQASAEALPFEDGSFDAALAIATIHHWQDVRRGLAELRRVARRVVIATWDLAVSNELWIIAEYFPQAGTFEAGRTLGPDRIADLLGGGQVRPVLIPADCEDGFIGAWWKRPEAYLDPVVRAGMSSIAAVEDQLGAAVARLEADLRSGAWHERHRDLLARQELDVGYRLVVAG